MRQKRRAPWFVKFWRRNTASLVAGLGLALAVAGALLTLSLPPTAVYVSADVVHVGTAQLHPAAPSGGLAPGSLLFTGDAAMVLQMHADGSATATAVTYLHGHKISGRCDMAAPTDTSLTEHCSFTIDARSLTADDTLDLLHPGAWHRTYSDGVQTLIGVPSSGGVVPVPFAVGR